MGLLDQFGDIASSLMGNQQQQGSPLLKAVTQMLSSNSGTGGLAGLLQNFQNSGLGDIVSSWVSTGQNQPISVEQIQAALGSDTVQQLAAKVGLSNSEVGAQLTQLLPNLVDKLTPGGQVPQGGALEEILAVLHSKLG